MSKNTDLAGYDTNLPVANLTATGIIIEKHYNY